MTTFRRKSLVARLGFLALLAIVLMAVAPCRATVFLEFDSAVLGDGWFQYKLKVVNDPFFIQANIPELGLYFTNQIDEGVSTPTWTNSMDNADAYWNSTQTNQARPYEVDFLERSSEAGYRLQTTNAAYGQSAGVVVFEISFTDFNPAYGGNGATGLVGYANLSALVPCATNQSDGSPTNYSYVLRLVPDVTIKQLLETNGVAYGVDFLWGFDSTFLLQGSGDLTNWDNIATIWSTWPETIWTTNRPLNDFGQFFRLQFVAGGYETNVPPAAVKKEKFPASTLPRFLDCHVSKGKIAVRVATRPRQSFTVTALDGRGVARAAKTGVAAGETETVDFDTKELPSEVVFKVTR